MERTITVREDGNDIAFTFADLMKYHGPHFPGGVAHAFKVMERAFPLLSPDAPLERREVEIDTSFGGPGGRDAFEMVTRVVSREKYVVDKALGEPWADVCNRQNYFFRFRYRDKSVELLIQPGHVREEFVALGAKTDRTAEEEERLTWLKQEMAERLLAADPETLYQPA